MTNLVNKEITKLTRLVKTALERDHQLSVPHAALRASLLTALGENPHAFGRARADATPPNASEKQGKSSELDDAKLLRELVKEAPQYFHPGYEFDGKKREWLERAGLVEPTVKKTLFLVGDDLGILSELALDADGEFRPWDLLSFRTALPNARLESLSAEIPAVSRYGYPDYIAKTAEFFQRFSLELSPTFNAKVVDLRDDSGDSCEITLSLTEKEWQLLLLWSIADCKNLHEQVCEWVGLHYRKNFATESKAQKAQWIERFLESNRAAA